MSVVVAKGIVMLEPHLCMQCKVQHILKNFQAFCICIYISFCWRNNFYMWFSQDSDQGFLRKFWLLHAHYNHSSSSIGGFDIQRRDVHKEYCGSDGTFRVVSYTIRSQDNSSDVRVSKSMVNVLLRRPFLHNVLMYSHQIWYRGSLHAWVYFLTQLC